MADEAESSSSVIGQKSSERSHPIRSRGERSVVAEFVDAARAAAELLLQKQTQQVADRVSGVAEALHGAARSLDQSQNRAIARYVRQAGGQIHSLTRNLQERRWDQLVADTEEFARRQPTWFVLGAVAAGFLVGRFLSTAMRGQSQPSYATQAAARGETAREVTAAISSAPGAGGGTGKTAVHSAGSSGIMEPR